MDDKNLVNVGKYIDDLFNAFHAQYGDVREKALAVIKEREALVSQEARNDEKRRCADIAVEYIATHTRGNETAFDGLHTAILQGTAPAKKQVPYSGDPETCECEYHRACRGELPAKELESNG